MTTILFISIASKGDVRRFTPFPKHIETTWKDPGGEPQVAKFMVDATKEPTAPDAQKVSAVIDKLPSVTEMQKYENTAALKEALDRIDRLCFPLLRWILTSNRAHVTKLKDHEVIQGLGGIQFTLLSTPPAKEKKFKAMVEQFAKEKRGEGKFHAFHGSAFFNWHSILRNGLRNLSGTALMSAGAAYGAGIYLGADSSTSMGYAGSSGGWQKSKFGVSNQCMAVCEVINAGYTSNPYYVVPKEDHVLTRYLVVFNSSNPYKNVAAKSLTVPVLKYSEALASLTKKEYEKEKKKEGILGGKKK